MSDQTQGVTRAHLGMVVWALIVGLSFPAVGLMSEGLPALLLTAIRFAIAAVALWPIVGRSHEGIPRVRALYLYGVMGLCMAGFFGAMFWAAHRATALTMSTLFVTVPLLAYALGRMFTVEHKDLRLLGILAVGAVGALSLAGAETRGNLSQLQFGTGEVVYFLGCLSIALYPVLSKWGIRRGVLSDNAATRAFWSLAAGSALIGVVGAILQSPRSLSGMTWYDMLLIVYLGVISSGVTVWLQQRATFVLTPSAVTAYSYLVPFVSMVLLLAGDPNHIGWHWLPGSVLVLSAISLLFRRDAVARNQTTHSTEPRVSLGTLDPAEAAPLIAELDAYLSRLYPAESNHLDPVDELATPNVALLGCKIGDDVAAVGAVKIMDGYGEIKRIYVSPRHRGKGLSKKIMRALEVELLDRGIYLSRLEVGIHQHEALGLYERVGYVRRAPFGAYQEDPLSIFMEKRLSETR